MDAAARSVFNYITLWCALEYNSSAENEKPVFYRRLLYDACVEAGCIDSDSAPFYDIIELNKPKDYDALAFALAAKVLGEYNRNEVPEAPPVNRLDTLYTYVNNNLETAND